MTVNATRLKEDTLKLNSNVEANFHKKEIYILYKDNLVAALDILEINLVFQMQCT